LVSTDGIDGVSTSYSSFVPSRRDGKMIDFIMSYKKSPRSSISDRAPPKFAIRSFLVRRTTNEQDV
jgi:hypothetical protein